MEWDLEMAGKYLDRDAVLKALEKTKDWPAYTIAEFQEAVEQGKFDAKEEPSTDLGNVFHSIVAKDQTPSKEDTGLLDELLHVVKVVAQQGKALSDKDAEIARLTEKYNEAKAAPHYPDGPWDGPHKAVAENQTLMDQIADLEKLCDMQKTTLDYERQVAYRLERLESDSKQDREIEGLVQKHLMDDSRLNSQENHIDRVETALKALQEEVSGIKKNPILSTYDENCKLYAEYQKRMAKRNPPVSSSGGAIQSPCLSCPNNPYKGTRV